MKKFVLKLVPFLILIGCLAIGIPMHIDPHNVFHVERIRDNGIEANKNYIKTSYVLENPDKFDSFLFGTSRVGAIHAEKIEGLNCYNMTYSVGLPVEHLANIKTFLKNGIVPKVIIIGVDEMAFLTNPEEHYSDTIRFPHPMSLADTIEFYNLYWNARYALDSQEISDSYESKDENSFRNIFYEYGWWLDYNYSTEWYVEEMYPVWSSTYSDRTDAVLREIQEIVAICEENQIHLIVFTNPVHELTYKKATENGYLNFLYELAGITDYYNFSGLNDVTTDNECFVDNSHYSAEVGDMILKCIFGEMVDNSLLEQGFGYYVTKENVDEFMEIIN